MRKRLLPFLLSLLCLLLFACTKSTDGATPAALAGQLRENLSARGVLILADDDFYVLNFPDAPTPAESVVFCSGTAPTTEFGIFRLESEKDAEKTKEAVREYLESEKESRASLARLYPSDDAGEDCARLENAFFGRRGKTVYYFIGDSENTARAKEILEP